MRHHPYLAGTPLKLARGTQDKFIDCVDETIAVQILRVNSQIYFEALSILYSQTFAFADGKVLRDFIRKINTEARPFIENVEIVRLHVATGYGYVEGGVRFGYISRAPNSTLNLTGLTGLKTLSIRIFDTSRFYHKSRRTGRNVARILFYHAYRDFHLMFHRKSPRDFKDVISFSNVGEVTVDGNFAYFEINFSCEEFNEEMARLVNMGDEYNPWGKNARLDDN